MKTMIKAAAVALAVTSLSGCWLMTKGGVQVGDRTCAKWNASWYGATITGREGDKFVVKYDDDDTGKVASNELKALLYKGDVSPGMKVLGQWMPRTRWYLGTVERLEADGAIVKWDDGSAASLAPYGRMAMPD